MAGFSWDSWVIRSNDDVEGDLIQYSKGEQIKLRQGERHRLVGLSDYAIIAEIWQHTSEIPSDEDDIVRVQDDFNR